VIRGPLLPSPTQVSQEGAYSRSLLCSPFRFLITVSAKALSRQLLRPLRYLHGALPPPVNLLMEPSPSQERLSRCLFPHLPKKRDLFSGLPSSACSSPPPTISQKKVKESGVTQSCPTLCDPRDCSLPGKILQARLLEWAAISFSRGSSQPRDRTQVSHIADRRFTIATTREAPPKK